MGIEPFEIEPFEIEPFEIEPFEIEPFLDVESFGMRNSKI